MDVLQELPVDQWSLLMEKVKDLWPLNVGCYYALRQNLKYPSIREYFQFKVFCPYGDIDIGYVAMKKRGEKNSLVICSTTNDTKKIEEAVLKTKLIHWEAQTVAMTPSTIIKVIDNVRPQIGLHLTKLLKNETFFLDKSTKPFENLKCPPETYMAELKQENVNRVDSVWPHQYPGSANMFSCFISNGLSYGLFSRDNELLAWMFINEFNFLSHLFCEEKHRKKGYGEYVLKYVINDQLDKGDDIYGYVVMGNEASRRLFIKLGFQPVDESAWIHLAKE